MSIQKYLKANKNIVLELNDEVEYLVDDEAVNKLESGDKKISLTRMVDRKKILVSSADIQAAFKKNMIVDYLDII